MVKIILTKSNHVLHVSSIIVIFGVLWGSLGLLLALTSRESQWPATIGLLMVSQAFCGLLVRHRFNLTQKAILPDFLSLYLFNQFITKTITALGVIARWKSEWFGDVGYFLAMRNSVPIEYQFQAEFIFLAATIIFTFIWRIFEGPRILAVWHEPDSKVLWWTYSISMFAYVVLNKFPWASSLGMAQNLSRLLAIGSIAVLLSGNSSYALGKLKSILAILALAPLFVFALRSGMKGEIVLVSFPVLLPIFRRISGRNLTYLIAFLIFILLFVFPFSQTWRYANWFSHKAENVTEIMSRVAESWEREGILGTAAESAAHWLSRGSSSEQGGLVMLLAERDGLIGPVLIENFPTIFIPRFLWPDKPLYMPGAWFTWYLGRARSPETATSATGMMLPTELYWMFGIAGVIMGTVILSFLYFQIWRYLVYRSVNDLIPLVALFALLSRSANLESDTTVYAYSSIIIFALYVLFFEQCRKLIILILSAKKW